MADQMVTPRNIDKLCSEATAVIIKALIIKIPGMKALLSENTSLKDEIYKIVKSYLSSIINKPITAQTSKFVKVAAPGPGRGLPGGGGGGGRGGFGAMSDEQKGKGFEKILGSDRQGLIDLIFDFIPGGGILKFIVKGLIKFAIPRIQKAAEQAFLNLDFKRREYILSTMQSFQEKMKPHELSPSAFKHILDSKGYKGQELSQGAYDIKTPAFQKEIEDEKAKNPEKFKLPYSYLQDKEVQDRKKGKKFKFYNPSKKEEESSEVEDETTEASSFQKFIKVSQNQNAKVDQELTRRVEAIKKILSSMNEETIKQAFVKTLNRNDITEEQKSAILEKQVDEYMRNIKPLQTYMDSMRKI